MAKFIIVEQYDCETTIYGPITKLCQGSIGRAIFQNRYPRDTSITDPEDEEEMFQYMGKVVNDLLNGDLSPIFKTGAGLPVELEDNEAYFYIVQIED